MKKITLPSGEYLMVEVPKFEPHLCPYIGNIRPALMYWEENDLKEIVLPSANYTLIGLCSEISEEEAKGVLNTIVGWDKPLYHNYEASGRDYRDIIESAFDNATESLASLVRSNGMEVDTTVLLKIKN